MKTRYLLIPLLCSAAAPALAQSAQSSSALEQATASRDDVVVTATRTPTPIDHVGQAITVFDADTITTRQPLFVTDLLRQAPGVTITRNGGPGTVAGVNIRGAETDQTVALIDGIKIGDPASPGGGFNFGTLLIGNIDRIEVLRGAQSVLWGSQAIGGVVNLITRQPSDTLTVNARGEGGWHDSASGVANIADRVGPVAFSLGGGYYATDGISAYDRGTERDGYRNYGANGNVSVALAPAVSIDLRGYYSNGRTVIDGYAPPTYAFGDTRAYEDTVQWTGYGGVNFALFGGRFHDRIGYAHTDTHRRDRDPDSVPVETFRSNGTSDRIDYQGDAKITDGIVATYGAEHEVTRATTASYGGPAERARARVWSVYGELAVTPVKALTLTGGIRHDDHSLFGGATVFSGNGVWSPNGGGTTLRASYSEGFKAPTLYQLVGDYGNRALSAERSLGWDAGVTQKALNGAVEASATYFRRVSNDLIAFVSCPRPLTGICVARPYGTYNNVARAISEGAEATLAIHPIEAFTVSASYTYLDATDRAAGDPNYGKRLARRPGSSVTVNADYRWGFGLGVGATVTAVGDNYDNAANTTRLDGFAIAGVRASYQLGRHVELYGRIENLFDARYETIYQYGQPGRAAYAGVRLGF